AAPQGLGGLRRHARDPRRVLPVRREEREILDGRGAQEGVHRVYQSEPGRPRDPDRGRQREVRARSRTPRFRRRRPPDPEGSDPGGGGRPDRGAAEEEERAGGQSGPVAPTLLSRTLSPQGGRGDSTKTAAPPVSPPASRHPAAGPSDILAGDRTRARAVPAAA